MDLATFKAFAAAGALVSGTLYLTGVFVAGLTFHNSAAVVLAIVTAGASYLGYLAHFVAWEGNRWALVALWLTWISIVFGVLAGLSLLVM
jgi:hypothetical protein